MNLVGSKGKNLFPSHNWDDDQVKPLTKIPFFFTVCLVLLLTGPSLTIITHLSFIPV